MSNEICNSRCIKYFDKARLTTLSILFLMISLLWSLPVFAQSQCEGINENPEWTATLDTIISDYNNGDYAIALDKAKYISEAICDSSPVLLYTQAKIYEAQKNNIKALLYFQKASEATYALAVPPDMAQKIWYARYENEHPDRTESALEETLQKLQEKDKEIETLKSQNANSEMNNSTDVKNKAKVWMWTGVGIDITGLALIGTGATLISKNIDAPSEIKFNRNGVSRPSYKTKSAYIAGWGMLGAGIAFTVVGTVLAGYFGYQYTHIDENLETAFSLTPTGASFSLNF